MARFTVRKLNFGGPPAGEDDGSDLPRPVLVRLQARRAAGIKEAKDTLTLLPEPGQSLHCLMTARLDMSDVFNALLEKCGRCDRMRIATLGYNRRNFKAMLRWLDAGQVGNLVLVASRFFQAHNGSLWEETLKELRARKCRACCAPSHAKVATLAFADGRRFVCEGSANVCSNGSAREQFALIHDATLHDWHAQWIEALVVKHEGQADQGPG